ncbi:MAG: Trehalose synthase [Labilithrix sp.]|nr:Trehalose synthase [Labilithrix sp.]
MTTTRAVATPGSGPRSARAPRTGLENDPLWYKDAVIYEVRTRSYYDSNGDGIGDLKGLTSKLDYLADLGVTALWLLPHYPSPGRDDGYDIADYTDIHPDIGTIEDFDELVAEAHRRNIRVITELVLNHTSDQHPWFQRARRAPPGSPERDFYVWSDNPDRYKEARIIFRDFEPSNWSWDPVAKGYFWHRFFAHQPDLNFENPAVHEAMLGVVDFWMARGVDGLRLDAVPYLYEAEGTNCENLPQTHAFLKKLRKHVDDKFPGRMLLAEANQWPEDAARYFGDGDECHMNFHFPIMPRLFMSIHMEDRFPIIDILRQTPELHPSCQWAMFLRNHDELTLEMVTDDERDYMYRAYAHETQARINLGIRRRLAPLVGNDRRKMELLNGLLFSMPGTPVLYYGDEIGMGDNVYLGDRNGVRTPMQWSTDRNAGFSRANPQKMILPIIIDPEYHYEALNVEAQQSNPNSLLWWTKRLIALRKRFQAFGRGSVEFLHPSNPRVLAFVRRFDDEIILVVANLSRHIQYVELDLASMKGMIPVELMGRTKFPTIGDLPYLLTLGGHDFYWFSLEPSRHASQEQRLSDLGPVPITCTSSEALLFGAERQLLEEALPAYLDAREWTTAAVSGVQIVEAVKIPRESDATAAPLVLAVVRVDYTEGEPDTFVLPLLVLPAGWLLPPGMTQGSIVAQLSMTQGTTPETRRALLVEANGEAAGRVLLDAVAHGATHRTLSGKVTAGLVPGASVEDGKDREPRIVRSDRLGVSIAFGTSYVLKLYYRMEEGTAPELEIGRYLDAKGLTGITPRVLGYVEYRVARNEPVTLAILEEFVVNEGTAWQHARSEIGRAYERVLAQPAGVAPPDVPTQPLLELAYMDPPAAHAELIGAYREAAMTLGRRTAELHIALSASTDASFEPHAYTAMDQRSKYQTARNLVGRVLASMRRTINELPASTRTTAEQVLDAEDAILARFEPLLTQRIDAQQIRHHGDLHLGRALFTGKDFVILDVGGARDRRLSERRRKGGAFRDVAAMIRSFHYAAATTLHALRPEDQLRAEPWGWIWQLWATAAFLRGYLDTANGAPFIPKNPTMTAVLLEASTLEKAFGELRQEMRRRPDMAWIPLQAIMRMISAKPPK